MFPEIGWIGRRASLALDHPHSPHSKAHESSLIWVEELAAWVWGLAGFAVP